MTVIRPQDSVVGVMLYWDRPAQLVAAEGIGFAQHNALTWEVDLVANDFVYENQPKKVLQDGFNQLLSIFWKSGDKKSSLPKLELPDFIKKLGELTNND